MNKLLSFGLALTALMALSACPAPNAADGADTDSTDSSTSAGTTVGVGASVTKAQYIALLECYKAKPEAAAVAASLDASITAIRLVPESSFAAAAGSYDGLRTAALAAGCAI